VDEVLVAYTYKVVGNASRPPQAQA